MGFPLASSKLKSISRSLFLQLQHRIPNHRRPLGSQKNLFLFSAELDKPADLPRRLYPYQIIQGLFRLLSFCHIPRSTSHTLQAICLSTAPTYSPQIDDVGETIQTLSEWRSACARSSLISISLFEPFTSPLLTAPTLSCAPPTYRARSRSVGPAC